MNFIQAYEKKLCSQAFHSEHQRYPKQSQKLPLLYKDILKDGMLEKQKKNISKKQRNPICPENAQSPYVWRFRKFNEG